MSGPVPSWARVPAPIELVRVTNGRVSAIHRARPSYVESASDEPRWASRSLTDGPRTVCGRSAEGMLPLPSDPWAAMGWRAASPGACQRCALRVA